MNAVERFRPAVDRAARRRAAAQYVGIIVVGTSVWLVIEAWLCMAP